MNRFRTHLRFSLAATVLGVAASIGFTTRPSDLRAGTAPPYSIDFHAIGAGGHPLRGHCYRLSATVGQVAPGNSSALTYSLIAGYWQPAPPAATNEIFFNEFEVC